MLMALCTSASFSQQRFSPDITFIPVFGDASLTLDSVYISGTGDSVKFETLRFYISGVQLFNNNTMVYAEDRSFHLLDASDPGSFHIALRLSSHMVWNTVKFNIGIDSITNVSGAQGGALDPVHGMYWAWQSGYINFKLEGKSSAYGTSKNRFEFHIGGYQAPFNTLRNVTVKAENINNLRIYFDLKKLLDAQDLKKQNHIMSPNKNAVIFSEQISRSFLIK